MEEQQENKENVTFYIDEKKVTFLDKDFIHRNREFLAMINEEYFKDASNIFEKDIHKDVFIYYSLFSTYYHGLETLFGMIGATVQARHYFYGWLLKYKMKDLKSLITKINDGKEVRVLTEYKLLKWDDVVKAIHPELDEDGREASSKGLITKMNDGKELRVPYEYKLLKWDDIVKIIHPEVDEDGREALAKDLIIKMNNGEGLRVSGEYKQILKWDDIVKTIHPKFDKNVCGLWSKIWQRLSKDFLSNEYTECYNGIKHGFRIDRDAILRARIKDRELKGSDYGFAFGRLIKKDNFHIIEKTILNLNPEYIKDSLALIRWSIFNIRNYLKCINPGKEKVDIEQYPPNNAEIDAYLKMKQPEVRYMESFEQKWILHLDISDAPHRNAPDDVRSDSTSDNSS